MQLWQEYHYCKHIYVRHQSDIPDITSISLLPAHLYQTSVRQFTHDKSIFIASTSTLDNSQQAHLCQTSVRQHIYLRHQSDSSSMTRVSLLPAHLYQTLVRDPSSDENIIVVSTLISVISQTVPSWQSIIFASTSMSNSSAMITKYHYCQHIYVRQKPESTFTSSSVRQHIDVSHQWDSTPMSYISQTAQPWQEYHYCQHIYPRHLISVRHHPNSTCVSDITQGAQLWQKYHNFQHMYARHHSDSSALTTVLSLPAYLCQTAVKQLNKDKSITTVCTFLCQTSVRQLS